ncbi:MAG: FAD binding domain-containing protein [Acidimicrobiales bacterium]
MITKELEFLRPATVAEALQALADRGDDITVLSGGMSLMPMMNLGIVRPGIVMSLNHVEGLRDISLDGGALAIGGMVTHRRVMADLLVAEHAPMLAEAAVTVGDVQVRNRGTVGGSICHADPSADYLPVLAVSGAEIVLARIGSERRVPASEFFIDVMFTVREPDELVTGIVVPRQDPTSGSAYVRFARVEGSFAIVNAAAVVEVGFVRTAVALGGVGPAPVVVEATDLFADGIESEAMAALAERAYAASSRATGDVHSDAEYRRHMAGVFARRAVEKAAGRL